MRNIILSLVSVLLCSCMIEIQDLDGSIIINVKDSGVDSSLEDASMDSTVSDTGVDSSIMDTGMDSMIVDAGNMTEASTMDVIVIMDTSVSMDAMHNHDANTTGINVDKIPVGDPGFSDKRIRSTDEQIILGNDVGAFRTECSVSGFNFDDPIVYPGQPNASHLHMFMGHVGVDAFSTPESIRNTGNSTCRGGILNRTAYWVPALISASGDPLMPDYIQFYYKSGYSGVKAETIQPFPPGLRIIAGYKDSPETNAGWGCLDNYKPYTDSIQSCPAGDKILMVIAFPQCWNGKDLDSADHRSHMAYGTGSGCPTSHPVPLTQIQYNIGWNVEKTSGARLSSDIMLNTQRGVSSHGDWFNGWDNELVKQWTKACVNSYGDCHSHLVGNNQMIY